jgi:CPA2 family monovalent cation:H+ antiporter-2
MQHEPWLKDIVLFLAAAGLVIPLFHRARIGAVVGFLLVGVAVGPTGIGLLAGDYPWLRYLTIEDRARVELFGELGIIALLFLIGLELSLPRLWSLRRYVAGIGGTQVLASAVLIGGIAALAGAGAPAAIILGLALAMSSTAIVMQLLDEQGRTATAVGRVALSVLLFQDLMVAPILSLTGVLGREGSQLVFALGAAVLQGLAAVAVIAVLGRFVLRPLLGFTAKTGSRDLIMAITVLMVVGVAGLTHAVGLSAALGAFLAGLLLSETAYRHQIEVDLEPFKGLLLGLFFVSVGMTIDLRMIWDQLGWILLAVAGLLAIKSAVLIAATRAFGVGWAVAIEVAVLLAQSGEFAFIVLGLARANGIVAPELAQFAIAVVGITMLGTPLMAWVGRRLGRRSAHRAHGKHMPDDSERLSDHVVIGGYGRVGQMIARLLEAEHVPFVALDSDGAMVDAQRKSGHRIYLGDASRGEFLDRAGAAHARAFVVTMNSPAANERMVKAILTQYPQATVFARAVDADHGERLTALGACAVVPETVEASLQLGGRVLEGLGLSDGAISQRLETVRDEELGRLAAASPGRD